MAAILSRPRCVFVFVFDELYLYLYLYLIRFLPVYLYLYLKLRKKMYLYLYLYLIKRIWPQPWFVYYLSHDIVFMIQVQWQQKMCCRYPLRIHTYDDAMAWKQFLHYWTFCGNPPCRPLLWSLYMYTTFKAWKLTWRLIIKRYYRQMR